MQNEFQIGDLVELKSGSPQMVVSEIGEDWITCTYWDHSKSCINQVDELSSLLFVKGK